VFGIHRSSFKAWKAKPKRINTKKVQELAAVRRIHRESNGSAGARTIAQIATDRKVSLSRYRVTRLMKQLGLVSCQLPKHSYKKAHQEHISIPNILDRQFTSK